MSQHPPRAPDGDPPPPELRDALAALSREREPGRLLEARTVRALRDRGLLHAPAARPALRRVPRAWLGGAVAAGLALFAGGVATGQYVGARSTAQVVEAMRADDAGEAARLVQRTGTAYVDALGQFASMTDSTAGPARAQGREVAVRMLRAAADELVRIAPDDPVAAAVLAAFQRADSSAVRTGETQRTVWF